MNSEKGQALPLALLILAIGSLVITPFIGQASSSLIGSRIYGETMTRQYAADGGAEYAIWYLQSQESPVPEGEELELPEFTINNRPVNVTIQNGGEQIYTITAVATSPDGGTTILSMVRVIPWVEGDLDVGGNDTYYGDVHVTGDVTVANNAEIIGDLTVDGDVTLKNNSEIEGDISVQGDVTLNNNSDVTGIVCATGDITLENNADITGDVRTDGNLTLGNNAGIEGNVFIGGDITLTENAEINGNIYATGDITITLDNNAEINGNIYATGDITINFLNNNAEIDGDVYATGDVTVVPADREDNISGSIYEDYSWAYPDPPACPGIPASPTEVRTWEITNQ